MKGIVFDKDGTLYSASLVLDAFAMQLSRHFDSKEFMLEYYRFKDKVMMGERYDPSTLEKSKNGPLMKNAFWVPGIVITHFGGQVDFSAESRRFFTYFFDRKDFLYEPKLRRIMSNDNYCKALVSNCSVEPPLDKLGICDMFTLKYLDADKMKNLDTICSHIDDAFQAEPKDIFWVDDDMLVLERLTAKGYETVLRKTWGLHYPGNDELRQRYARHVLEDNLVQLYELMKDKDRELWLP